MRPFGDPFFWALVSMFGLAGAAALVGSARLAKFRSLGFVAVGLFTIGRVVLVLPAVTQPRLAAGDWIWVVGAVIFAAGMVFALPVFAIRPIHGARGRPEPEDRRILRNRQKSHLSLGGVVVPRLGSNVPLGDRHRSGSRVVGGSVAADDNRGGEPRAEARSAVYRVPATSPRTYPPRPAAMIDQTSRRCRRVIRPG